METPPISEAHDEFRERLLADYERLNEEKWDLLQALHLNELAQTAVLEILRGQRPAA